MNSSLSAADMAPASTPEKPKPPLLKRLVLALVVIAALIAAVFYGLHWWTTGRFIESTDDAYIGGDVTVIGPKVSGYITELKVIDNQFVHAGDLLVKIDDRDYLATLHKAEGAIAAEEALLANLQATEQLQQAVIGQGKAGIDAASAETVRSRDDNVRYKELASRSAVSLESAQRADATFKTAQANGAKAQASLLAAQRQLDVIATQKQQARAALMQAKAERDLAQLNVGYTELRAPIDGVIGNRRARVGAFCRGWHPVAGGRSGQRPVGRCQLQGGPVGRDVARPTGEHSCRCTAGPGLPRSSGQPGPGHRRAIQRIAAGERHRQLHQNRPARAGAGTSRCGR